jgi:hypothetical protein
LKDRISEIGSRLTSLADKRRSYSLAASEGDTKAKAEIGVIDSEVTSLQRDAATFEAGISTAQALQRQEDLDLQQQVQREREVEAYNHARAIISLNLEVDTALLHLREMLERRSSLLSGLQQTEKVDPGFVARLSNKAALTRAACHAGLHRFLSIETCAPGSMVPLASTNETLLGIGKPPADDKSRVRFRGNGP